VANVDELSQEYINAHFDEDFAGLWTHNPLDDLN
jgi:hypothetical protein